MNQSGKIKNLIINGTLYALYHTDAKHKDILWLKVKKNIVDSESESEEIIAKIIP
jgi:hypothetical protein